MARKTGFAARYIRLLVSIECEGYRFAVWFILYFEMIYESGEVIFKGIRNISKMTYRRSEQF